MKRNGLEEFYINLKRNNINETILKEIEKEMRGEWKMKKEIENLLNSENAYLDLNKFCCLHRWQKNAFGESVDCLKAEFSITTTYDYSEYITARDWRGVVEQVRAAHTRAFAKASEVLSTELKAGYIRG